MIASGKRRPAFSAKHGQFMHALFPGSTRYTLTHSWSGTHRLFSVHCGPSKKRIDLHQNMLGIAVNLELPEEVEGKTFSTSCALRVEAPSERWSLKGQFTKSGEMHLTAVIQK